MEDLTINDFDFGAEAQEQESNIKVWPTEGTKVGLLDADAVPYHVGFTSTPDEYVRYLAGDTSILEDKLDKANALINRWVQAGGCDACIVYITDSSKNFRLDIGIQKEYKGQRKDKEKPPFFKEIKDWLRDFQNAVVSDCCEADDEISIEAWRRFDELGLHPSDKAARVFSDWVVLSHDKDLSIIPGWHQDLNNQLPNFWADPIGELTAKTKEGKPKNIYEMWPLFDGVPVNPEDCVLVRPHVYMHNGVEQDQFKRGAKLGQGKVKRVAVGTTKSILVKKIKGSGILFFFSQVLTGDSTDNYGGLPQCGATKAYELLSDVTDWKVAYERVFHEYLKYYLEPSIAMQRLIEQMRLAWMQTKPGELIGIRRLAELYDR